LKVESVQELIEAIGLKPVQGGGEGGVTLGGGSSEKMAAAGDVAEMEARRRAKQRILIVEVLGLLALLVQKFKY
jgi:hypothetical protein